MIQTVVAAVFIIFGLLLFATEIYGVNRFSFVMNRMHAAAIGDTLAMMSCMLGLIIYSGFNFKHYTKEQIIDEDDLSTFANETEEEE